MSDPTTLTDPNRPSASVHSPPPPAPRRERLAPAIGAVLVLTGLVALLDDVDLFHIPWWFALLVGGVGLAIALMAATIRSLLAPPPT